MYLSNAALTIGDPPPFPATVREREGSTERVSSPEENFAGNGHRYGGESWRDCDGRDEVMVVDSERSIKRVWRRGGLSTIFWVYVFVNDTGDVYSHEKIDLDLFFFPCFDFITGTSKSSASCFSVSWVYSKVWLFLHVLFQVRLGNSVQMIGFWLDRLYNTEPEILLWSGFCGSMLFNSKFVFLHVFLVRLWVVRFVQLIRFKWFSFWLVQFTQNFTKFNRKFWFGSVWYLVSKVFENSIKFILIFGYG